MIVLEILLATCLVCVPLSIPIYCLATFVWGLGDAAFERVTEQDCRKRYQVYSCYKLGVKTYHWMQQQVK